MSNNIDLTCPLTLELLDDPITLPCCGKTISRLPMVESLEYSSSCPLCRQELEDYNPISAPTSVNIAYLVEAARRASQPEEKMEAERPKETWKATLTILDKQKCFRQQIARLKIMNDELVYRNLLITVIDKSGSMCGPPIDQVKYSLKRITDLAYKHKNLCTSVVTYNDRAECRKIDTTSDKHHYDHIFGQITAGGGTSFSAAFDKIIEVATAHANDAEIACLTILFLTDGEDSSLGKEGRIRLVQQFKNDLTRVWNKEYTVHTVGFGRNHDSEFLNALRLIGTTEGAFRYADPSENDDILSRKINSVIDVIASSVCLPLRITASNFEIANGGNGTFWVKIPNEYIAEPISFAVDRGEELSVTPEVSTSDALWSEWYSVLIDDIADELVTLAKLSSGTEMVLEGQDDTSLERELHLELISRRANSILARLDTSDANYSRLTSLTETLENLRKGLKVDTLKLGDMKFEGKFATNIMQNCAPLSIGSSSHISVLSQRPLKKTVWPVIEVPTSKRFKADSQQDEYFIKLGHCKSDVVCHWIDLNKEHVGQIQQKKTNALHAASSIGRTIIAKKILENSLVDVNSKNKRGWSPLDLAVLYGYWKMYDLILKNGGKLTINPEMLLRTCISKNYTELASRLIKDFHICITSELLDNVPTSEGFEWLSARSSTEFPIETAILKGALDIVTDKLPTVDTISWKGLEVIFTKAQSNFIEIVELVLSSGKASASEITPLVSDEITFPLFAASEKGNLEMVRVLLKYLSKDEINMRNNKGTTALWISSCNKHIDTVYELILAGADVNIANKKGDSALIPCCQKGCDSVASLLLESGINMSAHNKNRDNAVLICCRTGQAKILEMLLNKYSKDELAQVLEEYAEIDGNPPLLAATELDRIECIKVCLKYGADLEWRTMDDNQIIPGATALHLACHYGRLSAAKTLCELGADLTAKTSVGGYTPLHVAIRSGNIALVRFLLSCNQDALNISDDFGRVPAYYASMQGREDIKEEFFNDRLSNILARVVVFGSTKCIDTLNKYGESIGCYGYEDFLSKKLYKGMTPLSLSLVYNNTQLANALEAMGARFDEPDDYGITPHFWKAYLSGEYSEYVSEQIARVNTVANKSAQNKILTNLSSGCPNLLSDSKVPIEFRKKMNDGFNIKTRGATLSKIKNASQPAILGFLEKLKNNKVFPQGKNYLEYLLWESRLHLVKLIASGETTMDPIYMMALYLYTSNATVFTNVNACISNYTDNGVWNPFVVCLYRAVKYLPNIDCEVYRGVDHPFDSKQYAVNSKITWNSFGVTSKDWNSSAELIKEKRGMIFIVQSKTGKDISKYSDNPVDNEVIFLPGTNFIVKALYRADVIALGQANIRTSTYAAQESDIAKAQAGTASIIIELEEC